ncbi:hypothetical protein [Sinorhizobium meliloti]|uniref:hypothetical protein n=1 Tax=Rhizobium meliloti TaxID=382 RepID=UPI000FD4E527|nr:hypothetical protein [Sinorhizobium meliloti]MDE3799990.1 hypothetical protein [Sinorhizobium meliloti]MDW9509271.1 hypothetical protein [Sinorhizobium meliloti]MDW9801212.1 hypothetical protein [Sinorhizobium meliloti]MDX0141488.1 hypothetical protein [Sinorhizobium meliloti]MDX0384818.1 hypothetical protein [Sinorhizobium meliloti]
MAESAIAINSLTTLAAAKPGRQPPLVILFLIHCPDASLRLSAVGGPLDKLNAILPWPVFEKPLAKALKRSDASKGGRPPFSSGADVQDPDASGALESLRRPG